MIHGFVISSLGCTARGAAWLLIATVPLLAAHTKRSTLTVDVANQVRVRWPEGHISPKGKPTAWGFELGIVLAGMNAVWNATNDPNYLPYLKHAVDQFVR